MLALGILAICLGGLGSAFLYTSLAATQQVLGMTRTVYRGEVLKASDFTAISMTQTPGVVMIPAQQAGDLVGRTALTDLPAGTLAVPSSIGIAEVPAGSVRMGLRLAAGRLPVSALPAGTPVLLVPVAGANGQAADGASVEAFVAMAPMTQADGSSLLDVTVPATEAERIARLAAADQVAMVRKSGG